MGAVNLHTTASEIISLLLDMRNDKQRETLMRFFKTGKGEYGEGDEYLGIRAPETRSVVKSARLQVPLSEIKILLESKWHEVRLCGFLLLVEEMMAALPKRREMPTIRLATELLHHPHDLMHKAVGWMLREVGKKDIDMLSSFLREHAATMPRTALRYAIEKMGSLERAEWMNYKNLHHEI